MNGQETALSVITCHEGLIYCFEGTKKCCGFPGKRSIECCLLSHRERIHGKCLYFKYIKIITVTFLNFQSFFFILDLHFYTLGTNCQIHFETMFEIYPVS